MYFSDFSKYVRNESIICYLDVDCTITAAAGQNISHSKQRSFINTFHPAALTAFTFVEINIS